MAVKKTDLNLTIAVISDIHAFDDISSEKDVYSHLKLSVAESDEKLHPFSSLFKLIESKEINLAADILICAGDMGCKANPTTIKYTWDFLQKLKLKLNAKTIIATPGNHDHDSRSEYTKYDPKIVLQSLTPPFPYDDEALNNKFWAKNYAIFEGNNYRVVNINSSAFHGTKDEHKHGRIIQPTIDNLEKELDASDRYPINILTCHHHPQKHEDIELEDYEVMIGGQKLLEVLGSGKYGQWFVIHGHIHRPKLTYAAGNSISPIVFSAGSFSAILDEKIATIARNQFYLIEFEIEKFITHGFVGTFRSWDWQKGTGWIDSSGTHSGLPARGGFGYRKDISLIASMIKDKIIDDYYKWEHIVDMLPELSYMSPGDYKALIWEIKTNSVLKLDVEVKDDLIIQIGNAL